MNTVNQVFDWSRFTAAVRKEVVENKRTLMFTVIAAYALLSIVMILGNLIFGTTFNSLQEMEGMDGMKEMEEVGFMQPHYMVVGYILAFALTIVASLSFKKLTKKTGRIDMFTSPTSTLEKFLVNVLIYVLGFVVVFFICAQLADLTRIAVLWYFHDDIDVPGPINFLNTFTQAYDFGPVDMFGMSKVFSLSLVASAGLFLLGSVLWPRLSWLKTVAVIYAIEICLTILTIMVSLIVGGDSIFGFMEWMTNNFSRESIKYWFAGFLIVEIVLCWGLAWFLFKRKDVISLKWWK